MPIAMRLLAAPIAAVCFCANAQAGDLSVVGTGDGIDLLRALGAAYTADHPDTNVIVPPSIGSGGGVAAVGSNKEVLARVARPLSDSEKEAGLIATPVFRLPSAFFVHRSAGVSSLSSTQLALPLQAFRIVAGRLVLNAAPVFEAPMADHEPAGDVRRKERGAGAVR